MNIATTDAVAETHAVAAADDGGVAAEAAVLTTGAAHADAHTGPAPTAQPTQTSDTTEAGEPVDGTEPEVTRDGELASDLFLADEPGLDTEADRDTPHPSVPGHPLDPPSSRPPRRSNSPDLKELIYGMGAAGRHDLAAKLAAIKHAADTSPTGSTGSWGTTGIGRSRPGRTKLYIHLTDQTLLAGVGTTRVEAFGPVYATKLAELLGHDHITIQPVIDLNQHLNVNTYEIPSRLRERIKLMYPVEQFPYGPGETTNSTDLDHITPYNAGGPPGQTSTTNLQPLRRISHRVKTHAPGWTVTRINDHTTEWTTPHGYTFHVNNTGTHAIRRE